MGNKNVEVEATEELQVKEEKPKRSREAVFGSLLLSLMIIFVIAALVSVGFAMYFGWQEKKQASRQPSITALSEKKDVVSQDSKTSEKEEEKKVEENTDAVALDTKTKGVEITILNGGVAKGSAGTFAEVLKKEGYLKVTPGNTVADYTGTVVYFASGLEKEAEIVLTTVIKTYPKATAKPAVLTNKETSTKPITIILGK